MKKFKVFNPQVKRMFSWEELIEFWTLSDFDLINQGRAVSKSIILQFTGLQDKKGVDIYEGDIVKVKSKHGFNSALLNEFKELNNLDSINGICGHFSGIIRIDFFRGLMLENPSNGFKEPIFTRNIDIRINHSGIEIIGNIHENPELI